MVPIFHLKEKKFSKIRDWIFWLYFFMHVKINGATKMFICASPKIILSSSQGYRYHLDVVESGQWLWRWLHRGSHPALPPSAPM